VIACQVRHPRWAVWSSECLARHLSSASYQDRLFIAHFAVITFGLVALLGAWHDPSLSMCVAFGLSALLAFLYLGSVSFFRQRPMIHPRPDASFICYPRQMRRAWVLRMLLEFIRRAHLSCGAPPQLWPSLSGSQRMGIQSHVCCFESPSFLIFSFRR
jgi:Na+/proline symporter